MIKAALCSPRPTKWGGARFQKIIFLSLFIKVAINGDLRYFRLTFREEDIAIRFAQIVFGNFFYPEAVI